MDPDAALVDLSIALGDIQQAAIHGRPMDEATSRATDAVEALMSWAEKGGFAPQHG